MLHRFYLAGDGATPAGGLLAGASGALYGATWSANGNYGGVVFKVTP